MSDDSALSVLEASLGWYPGRLGQRVLERWERACPLLGSGGLRSPRDLPKWVWSLGRDDADRVLRMLVAQAQAGDAAAVAAVLACLRPGLFALAVRTGLSVDEVLSEVALGLLRFPLARRASVAGQLLLDARRVIGRRREKERDVLEGDTRVALEDVEAPGELGVEVSAAEQLVQMVVAAWRAGDVGTDEARLILETRIAGTSVAAAAARRSVNRTAAYQRRQRAEKRLARVGHMAVPGGAGHGASRRRRVESGAPARLYAGAGAWVDPPSAVASGRPRPLGERDPEELP